MRQAGSKEMEEVKNGHGGPEVFGDELSISIFKVQFVTYLVLVFVCLI